MKSGGGWTLFDHVEFLWSQKMNLILVGAVAVLVASGVSLSLPKEYRASTTLLVSSETPSPLDMLMGDSHGANSMVSQALNFDSGDQIYLGLLKSRRLNQAIIEQFHLQEVYETESIEMTLEKLFARAQFSYTKEEFLQISVIDEDPKRASSMANAFSRELITLDREFDLQKASVERGFLSDQLDRVGDKLRQAEVRLKEFQETHDAIELNEQAVAVIENISMLRAELTAEEVRYEVLRLGAGIQSGEVRSSSKKIEELKRHLANLEGDEGEGLGPLISVGRLPELTLNWARLFRDVTIQGKLFELLQQQYLMAQVREKRTSIPLQVVDPAEPPKEKFRPRRILIVALSTVVSTLLAIVFFYFVAGWRDHFDAGEGVEESETHITRGEYGHSKAEDLIGVRDSS